MLSTLHILYMADQTKVVLVSENADGFCITL